MAVGVESVAVTGVKEQLRFVYHLLNGASPAPTDAVRFNMLVPQWRPY